MDFQLVEPIRKNYEERMNEFVNILNREDCLPGSKVLDLWRFHLELTLKKSGWIALYKPSKGVKQISPSMDFNSELLMVRYYFYIIHPPFILNNNNIIFITRLKRSSSTILRHMLWRWIKVKPQLRHPLILRQPSQTKFSMLHWRISTLAHAK